MQQTMADTTSYDTFTGKVELNHPSFPKLQGILVISLAVSLARFDCYKLICPPKHLPLTYSLNKLHCLRLYVYNYNQD
jgi:hypothetical protein